MATSLRDLRRKIRSITSTQKITSAMQLVAASKMQRATRRATESRAFSRLAQDLVATITPAVDPAGQPLFQARPVKNVVLLVVTTNRGLAGPLNTQLFRRLFMWERESLGSGIGIRYVVVGTKGRVYFLRYARDRVLADFPAPDAVPGYGEAAPMAQLLIDEFLAGGADAVYLAYNRFVSTLRQEPTIEQYLPFQAQSVERSALSDQEASVTAHSPLSVQRYPLIAPGGLLFEPSRAEILATLLPRYLKVRLYQVLLETHASEQSARMLAMKNATDNAGDLIDDLSLTYNGVRQAAITGELLDIAAGASALEA